METLPCQFLTAVSFVQETRDAVWTGMKRAAGKSRRSYDFSTGEVYQGAVARGPGLLLAKAPAGLSFSASAGDLSPYKLFLKAATGAFSPAMCPLGCALGSALAACEASSPPPLHRPASQPAAPLVW